jgi:endogenous inhibitor of DNA gyrase (YacG/DUF329 family)
MIVKCPICHKESKDIKENKHWPFCCALHKDSDLYGWFFEENRISGDAANIPEEDILDGLGEEE